jgi:hypothetical protein
VAWLVARCVPWRDHFREEPVSFRNVQLSPRSVRTAARGRESDSDLGVCLVRIVNHCFPCFWLRPFDRVLRARACEHAHFQYRCGRRSIDRCVPKKRERKPAISKTRPKFARLARRNRSGDPQLSGSPELLKGRHGHKRRKVTGENYFPFLRTRTIPLQTGEQSVERENDETSKRNDAKSTVRLKNTIRLLSHRRPCTELDLAKHFAPR